MTTRLRLHLTIINKLVHNPHSNLILLPPLCHTLVECISIDTIPHQVHRHTAKERDQLSPHCLSLEQRNNKDHSPELFDFFIPRFVIEEKHVGVRDPGLFVD